MAQYPEDRRRGILPRPGAPPGIYITCGCKRAQKLNTTFSVRTESMLVDRHVVPLILSAGLAHLTRRDLKWLISDFGTSSSPHSCPLLSAAYPTPFSLNAVEAAMAGAEAVSTAAEAAVAFMGAAVGALAAVFLEAAFVGVAAPEVAGSEAADSPAPVVAVLAAVFPEVAFAAAAASQAAALEALAVLAAPIEVQHPLRVWARILMQVHLEDRAGIAPPTAVPHTEGHVRMARLAAAALPIM